MFSPLEQFDVIIFGNFFINIFLPFFILLVLIMYINIFKFNWSLIPSVFQYIFERIIEFIFNLIKQQIGSKGYIYFPFIFIIFNFLLAFNLLSLIPFGIALTSHIILNLWLSLSICLSIFITVFIYIIFNF